MNTNTSGDAAFTNRHDDSPEAALEGQGAFDDIASVDQAAQVLDRIATGKPSAAGAARPTIRKRDPEASRKAPKMPQGVWWEELDRRPFPKRGWLVQGLLKDHDVAMVYSPTGVGKTWFTLSLAVMIAGGGSMADRFCCDRPRKVLLLDGEMSMDDLQERIRALAPGLGADAGSCPEKWCRKLLSAMPVLPGGLLPAIRPTPAQPAG